MSDALDALDGAEIAELIVDEVIDAWCDRMAVDRRDLRAKPALPHWGIEAMFNLDRRRLIASLEARLDRRGWRFAKAR